VAMSTVERATTAPARSPPPAPQRASRRPSRLPLHRPRPSAEKSNPEQAPDESSHTAFPNKGTDGRHDVVDRSRPPRRSKQERPNRMLVHDRSRVADEQRQPQPSQRRDVINDTSRPPNVSAISNSGCAVRPAGNSSCGVRMSALRSADRPHHHPLLQQPQSSSSSVKSSSSTVSAARLHREAGSGVERGRAALSHGVRTSSSPTSPHYRLPHAPVTSTGPPASSPALNDVANSPRGRDTRQSSAASRLRRTSATKISDEITSSKSDRIVSPLQRHLPTVNEDTNNSNISRSKSGATEPSNITYVSDRHGYRSATVVEPSPHSYCHLCKSDADNLSKTDSMSTITSIGSSSSLSGTLTDEADESEAESTTTTDFRDRPLRDRGGHHSGQSAARSRGHAYKTSGHQTRNKQPNPFVSCALSSSTGFSFAPNSTSTAASQRQVSAENYSKCVLQRIGSFGTAMPPSPAAANQQTSVRQHCFPSRGAANRLKSEPTLSVSNKLSLPWNLTSESGTETAAGCASSSSVDDGSSKRMNTASNSTPKSSNSPPKSRQTAAVEKAAHAAAGRSSDKSSVGVSRSSASLSSKVFTCQSQIPRASSTASSRISNPASNGHKRRSENGTRLHTQVVDKDISNVANYRKLAGNTKSGVSRSIAKPCTPAVKHISSSQSETAVGMDNNRLKKTATRGGGRIQKPLTGATRSSDSGDGIDQSVVTKRPPAPPTRLKRPGSVSGVTTAAGRGPDNAGGQTRPASTDCSTVNAPQRSPDVCRNRSSAAVANFSTLIQPAPTTKTTVDSASLNKSGHELTKSCDCITECSGSSKMQNLRSMYSQLHGSTKSLVDVPPHRLVKPYSAINRCSTFGRKMAPLKENCGTTKDLNTDNTEQVPASKGYSVASQLRSSELADLPESDEFECDRLLSAAVGTDISKEGAKSHNGGQQSTVETRETNTRLPTSSDIRQTQTKSYRYRSEYCTFLSVVPPQSMLTVEVVEVASDKDKTSCRHDSDCSTTKQETNSTTHRQDSSNAELPVRCDKQVSQSSAKTVEDFLLTGDVGTANTSRASTARPATLSVDDLPVVEEKTVAAAATTKASPEDSYVVTYESDNIVVLDREPVIDCLTPDGDVVRTDVRQLLSVPANIVGAGSGEGALSRTLPLSESGYDTWKSSQGSVAVAATSACTGSICIPPPEQQQPRRHGGNGTLRNADTFDGESVLLSSEESPRSACEKQQPEGDEAAASSFQVGDDRNSHESSNGVSVAATELNDGRCSMHCESPCGGGVDGGPVTDDSVADSARTVAQMFLSICSNAVEPVAAGASSSTAIADSHSCESSLSSPQPDNVVSGLAVDPSYICFSSKPHDDGDVLRTCRTSPINAAHLERLDEDAHNPSPLMPAAGQREQSLDVIEIDRASNNADGVLHDVIVLCPATRTSVKTTAYKFDSNDDPKQSSDDCRRLVSGNSPVAARPPSSTAAVADVATNSTDTYETVCDDLLESVEAEISDSEGASRLPRSTSASVRQQPKVASSENPEEAASVVSGGRGVVQTSKYGRVLTVYSSSRPTTAGSGRRPVTTLRRLRTNFSVVCQQVAQQPMSPSPGESLPHDDGHNMVRDKAGVPDMVPGRFGMQSGAVGCRRALSVLASRLDEHSNRCVAEKSVKGRKVSQSVDEDRDAVSASPAVRLSPKVRPFAFSSKVPGSNDVVEAWSDGSPSPLNGRNVVSVAVESKLLISNAVPSQRSVSKMPTTFRKLLSSRLTGAVRRVQAKHD